MHTAKDFAPLNVFHGGKKTIKAASDAVSGCGFRQMANMCYFRPLFRIPVSGHFCALPFRLSSSTFSNNKNAHIPDQNVPNGFPAEYILPRRTVAQALCKIRQISQMRSVMAARCKGVATPPIGAFLDATHRIQLYASSVSTSWCLYVFHGRRFVQGEIRFVESPSHQS